MSEEAEKLAKKLAEIERLKERLQEKEAGLTQQDRDIRYACEGSIITFSRYAWNILEPKSREFKTGWAIDGIAEHLHAVTGGEINRLLISVPPGFMKSMLTKIFWPAWEWGPQKLAEMRYVTASYADHLSMRDARKMKLLITNSWYQRLWPSVVLSGDQAAKSNFHNTANGFMLGTSVGGLGTGERGDRFICLLSSSMVLCRSGYISIGDIVNNKLDVEIAGYDGKSIRWQRIENWQKNPFRPLIEIQFDGGSIKCTEGHRIFTQRGYVPASEIIEGDRLWGIGSGYLQKLFYDNNREAKQNSYYKILLSWLLFCYRQTKGFIRKQFAVSTVRNDGISSTSAFEKNPRRIILQSQMSRNIQSRSQQPSLVRWSENPHLRTLQETVHKGRAKYKKGKILLNYLLQPLYKITEEKLWALQETVHIKMQKFCILLKNVCRIGAFFQDAWRRKWKICTWEGSEGLSSRMVERSQEKNKRSGQKQMSPLRNDGETAQCNSSRSPYRLYEREYFSEKFNNIMPFLPWPDAWKFKTKGCLEERNVISVKKITEIHDCTYNISVDPCHNFFADGILVKNCDDPNSVKDSESKLVRESTNQWFLEVVPTRLNSEESSILVIQQRTNEDDVTGTILEHGLDYVHFSIPMEFDSGRKCITSLGWEDPRKEENELAWPERFPQKIVDELKKTLGPYASAAQLQQAPSPRGGGIIKREYWKEWITPPTNEYPPLEFIIASADTAYTEKQINDYSACVVMGIYRDQFDLPKIMVMHAWQERLALHDLVLKLAATAKKYKIDKLLIENKASGISVAQEMRRLFANDIFGVTMVDPKGDKMARVMSIETLFAEGIVTVPCILDPDTGCTHTREWVDMLINQVTSFPRAKNDDLVDALTHGIKHLRNHGLITRREERDIDIERQMSDYKQKLPLYDV